MAHTYTLQLLSLLSLSFLVLVISLSLMLLKDQRKEQAIWKSFLNINVDSITTWAMCKILIYRASNGALTLVGL